MKRLIKEIKLVMFQDDATGGYGLTHYNTQTNDYNGFNAFWNGLGIFHDTYEHFFEYENKYFKDEYAMNIGGEMCAMGHMWYYQNKLGLHHKRNINKQSGYYSNANNMRRSTEGMIHECIIEGYCNFGDELLSNVPNQRPIHEDSELEYQLELYWNNIKKLKYTSNEEYQQEKESSELYKKSVTFKKIADLHRYGYRQAEKLIPNNFHNLKMMEGFIDYWDNFCKNNDARELYDAGYENFIFKLYKENDNITWTCFMRNNYPLELKHALLKENTNFYLEDCYVLQEEY